MTISQDEIVSNAKSVTKGLEALRQEHESILTGKYQTLKRLAVLVCTFINLYIF